jgi:lipoprotein-anchoring transpeptidase ErfK/SrfK
MGFQGSSLGIHGTIWPDSIGSYASNGCVGMLKDDVEELYDLVRIGTPILIKGQIQDPDGDAA